MGFKDLLALFICIFTFHNYTSIKIMYFFIPHSFESAYAQTVVLQSNKARTYGDANKLGTIINIILLLYFF